MPQESLTLLSAMSAARALGVDRSYVTRLVQSGKLRPATWIDHESRRVPVFWPRDVERLRALRAGEVGDVIDRVDIAAAEREPTEDRGSYIRDAWLAAIRTVTARTGGTFNTGQLRAYLPEDAKGPQAGALITALVRSRVIEATGQVGELGNASARNGTSPCKTYRVVGLLP